MKRRLMMTGLPERLKTLKKLKVDSVPPRALFVFRRDLRLFDNTALISASKDYSISPIFILTPEQLADNEFKSSNAIQFLVNSLIDLQQQISREGGTLYILYGKPTEVIKQICEKNEVGAIFCNRDYTPYSINRDEGIKNLAVENSIQFNSLHDCILMEDFDQIKSTNGSPYFLFSHFHAKATKITPRKCCFDKVKYWSNLECDNILNFKKFLLNKGFYTENPKIFLQGGRAEGLNMLNEACKTLKNYSETRNDLNKRGTTRLSAHNKFGTLSIRELYFSFLDAFGKECELIKQLYWRDFFYYLGHFHPQMYEGAPIPPKQHFKVILWEGKEDFFKNWCQGNTGFPLVDAGMREMNTTGYMHNRVRMVVAMFLSKDLLIDWRRGEKYFSQRLIDIDRAQNCGNWAWCAGVGADGSPWLRIFNPWTQLQKLDPQAQYIKTWVPELAKVSIDDILHWDEAWKKHPGVYSRPIVDHKIQRELAYKAYGVKKN